MDILGISAWVFWLGAAVIFFILEVLVPGFWLATLGIGALATFIALFAVKSITAQLMIFACGIVVAFFFIRPFALKYMYSKRSDVKTNTDALVGRKVMVLTAIDDWTGKGTVKIEGDVWTAYSHDQKPVPKGAIVEIIRVDSAKLIVKEISEHVQQ